MQRISDENQALINEAEMNGIDLTELRKKYTLAFTMKLFKHLKAESEKDEADEIEPLYPERTEEIPEYIDKLEEVGFKIRRWQETTREVGTGRPIVIQKYAMQVLK